MSTSGDSSFINFSTLSPSLYLSFSSPTSSSSSQPRHQFPKPRKITTTTTTLRSSERCYFKGYAKAPLKATSACLGVYGKGAYPGYAGNLLVDSATGASFNAYGSNGRKFLLAASFDPSTSSYSTLVNRANWEKKRENERCRLLMKEAQLQQQGNAWTTVNKHRSRLFEKWKSR